MGRWSPWLQVHPDVPQTCQGCWAEPQCARSRQALSMAQEPLTCGSVVWLLSAVVVCHGHYMLGSMLCITSYLIFLVTPR